MKITAAYSKVILFTAIFLFSLVCFPLISEALNVHGLEKLRTDVSAKAYYVSVGGNEDQSILKDGFFYDNNFTFSTRDKILKEYDFEWFLNFRSTDDPLVDNRNLHLLRLYGRVGKPDLFNLEFGDIYSNFSRYSLSAGLEGLQGSLKFDVGPEIYLKPLIVAARSQRAISSAHYARYVVGGRMEGGLKNRKTVIGLNVSTNWDDTGSLGDGERSAYDNLSPDDNYVCSVDLKLRDLSLGNIRRITADAEIAKSRFDDDVEDYSVTTRDDWAFRSSISGALEKLRFNAGYERAQPYFHNNLGSAAVDLESFRTNLRYDMFRWFSIVGNYATYRNNLKDQLENTQRSYVPRLSLLINPDSNLSFELLYRHSRIISSTQNPRNNRNTYTATGRYAMRKGYVSLSAEYEDFENKADPAIDSRHVQVSLTTGLRGIRLNRSFKISPSLTYSFGKEKYPSSGEKDIYNSFRINSIITYNNFLVFRAGFSINDNNRAAELADSSRIGWLVSLTARPENAYGLELELKYEDRNNRYEDELREFRERVGTLNCRFRF